jgi:hypothetical protein
MVVESGKTEKGSSKILAHRGAENAAAKHHVSDKICFCPKRKL